LEHSGKFQDAKRKDLVTVHGTSPSHCCLSTYVILTSVHHPSIFEYYHLASTFITSVTLLIAFFLNVSTSNSRDKLIKRMTYKLIDGLKSTFSSRQFTSQVVSKNMKLFVGLILSAFAVAVSLMLRNTSAVNEVSDDRLWLCQPSRRT
jgi:hypothetical protein